MEILLLTFLILNATVKRLSVYFFRCACIFCKAALQACYKIPRSLRAVAFRDFDQDVLLKVFVVLTMLAKAKDTHKKVHQWPPVLHIQAGADNGDLNYLTRVLWGPLQITWPLFSVELYPQRKVDV